MPRVGFPGASRLEWYDRNPSTNSFTYVLVELAPHAIADRFSYTVPTGKKAMVEAAVCKVIRKTAAAPAGLAKAIVTVRGGTLLTATILTNNVGDQNSMCIGSAGVLAGGETNKGRTEDDSTGGTVIYQLAFHVTEFSA